MRLPVYNILPEGNGWRINLCFRGDVYPMTDHLYSSIEIARLAIRKMEREDLNAAKEENSE